MSYCTLVGANSQLREHAVNNELIHSAVLCAVTL